MNKRKNVILIVDDTPENLRVLGELLEADGHEVLVATQGTHALEIARGSGVDLVLLDIMMPGIDGYEVCRRLKRDKVTKKIPVIFLTALDSTEDEAKGLALGAVDYIAKPFKLELVRSRVQNQLALHNARRELERHSVKLEELVAERSQQLAEAHRRLLTIDSAKYDFLQLIYQKLWAPGKGIIDLSREALASVDAGAAGYSQLRLRYEESQAELFDMINNALLMAGSHVGDEMPKAQPLRMDTLFSDALAKWTALAEARNLRFQTDLGRPSLASGDLDLVFQVFATVLHASVLMAREGSPIHASTTETPSDVTLVLTVEDPLPIEGEWGTLFEEGNRLHPSEAGKTLGLTIPLALKIVRSLGGSITLAATKAGGWSLKTTLPRFTKRPGARITL